MRARLFAIQQTRAAWVLSTAVLASGLLAAAFASVLPRAGVPSLPSAPHGSLSAPSGLAEALSARLGAGRRAYWAHASGSEALAHNPAQDMRVAFSATRVALSAGEARFALSVKAYGAGTKLQRARATIPEVRANRVQYARPGLSEWYLNGPLGLEQGFTIPRASVANSFSLELSLRGAASARLAEGGRRVTLSGRDGRQISYGHLLASDATGRPLYSRMTLSGNTLTLHVELAGAHYPVTVDPLVSGAEGQEELERENATSEKPYKHELFGTSVALSADGSTAVVGAPGEHGVRTGNAWVFARHGSTWREQQELQMPEGSPEALQASGCEPPAATGGCMFGESVAISADGDVLVVGDPPFQRGSGAAYVYTRSGEDSPWKLGGELSVASGRSPDLGASVALSQAGETVLVGAPDSNSVGGAYVFQREGEGWSAGQLLEVSEASRGSGIGESVALSGDGNTALLGAPEETREVGGLDTPKVGAAYTFRRLGSSWEFVELLPAEGEVGEGRFGKSVALSDDGTKALVGAPRDDGTSAGFPGAAWAYVLEKGKTQSSQKLTGGAGEPPPAEASEEEFGGAVALSGAGWNALVGAAHKTGSAWLFTDGAHGWGSPLQVQAATESDKGGHFGASVALDSSGQTLLVGAPRASENSGSAWIFGARPVVESLQPAHGPVAGGSHVTIKGINFTEVKAVYFGSSKATLQEATSADELVAVAPPGEPITPPAEEEYVDVTVETASWLSSTTTADQFKYVQPIVGSGEEGGEQKGKGGHGGSGGGNSSSNGGSDSATGPLPTGLIVPTEKRVSNAALGITTRSAPCAVRSKSSAIAVSSTSQASITLIASGTGRCSGRISLRVKEGSGTHKRTITLGGGAYSLLAGHRESLRLKLIASARALLRSHSGRLKATLVFARRKPGPAKAFAASVTLATQQR